MVRVNGRVFLGRVWLSMMRAYLLSGPFSDVLDAVGANCRCEVVLGCVVGMGVG
jgi:hypothetical protein